MIKRYYRSLVTLRYAVPQTIIAICVFVFAFLTFHSGSRVFYWIAVCAGVALVAMMIYVQIVKSRTIGQLKNVKHINQYYDEGAVLGRSFFLEDRMLLCSDQMRIQERSTSEVKNMKVMPAAKGRYLVQLDDDVFTVDNSLQAERLAAFLQKKNKGLTVEGIEPGGKGTFAELKAE